MTSQHTPRVTIGLPVYNGETFVGDAIRSILEQEFDDFELLIADNASTDATADICRSLAEQDDRIRYERSPVNRGAARNFNGLVDVARGGLFKWAAHDDLLDPRYLGECVSLIDSDQSAVLAHTRTTIVDASGSRVRDYENPLDPEIAYRSNRPSIRFREMIRGLHACYEVFGLIRTGALRGSGRIGPFISSDRVLLAELALNGRFAESPERLFLSRDHEGRSVRRLPVHDRASWFDSSQKQRITFPYWRVQRELKRAINRSEATRAERRRARWYLTRSTVRQSHLLRGDVLRAGRILVSRLGTRQPH